jgi:hypothetical protein
MDWFGRRERKLGDDAFALVEESTAFLTGHYLARVASAKGRGSGAPAWAQVNALAHARPDSLLRQLELQRRSGLERPGSWSRTRFDILREVVDLADGRPGRIEQLQRGCLIPLELRLMTPFRDVQPTDVLILALTRLHAHPLALRRRMATPPEL